MINGQEYPLFYTSKDGPDKIKIEKEDGKFECPFCKIYFRIKVFGAGIFIFN